MNKFTKNFYDGTVLSFDGKVYYIRLPGGKNVIMKFTVMHQMCSFPDSMLENGHIKDGTKIHLCEIRRSDGETILPDHRYYFDANKRKGKHFLMRTWWQEKIFADCCRMLLTNLRCRKW